MNRTFAATGAVLILVLALREPSQAQTPSPTAEATAAPEAKAQPESSSVSPDQKWGYADEDGPKLVKAGTNEVALDLDGFGGFALGARFKAVCMLLGRRGTLAHDFSLSTARRRVEGVEGTD